MGVDTIHGWGGMPLYGILGQGYRSTEYGIHGKRSEQ